MALGDDFTAAIESSNNTLTQTPGLAVDAATSGDPATAGLILSHAAATQAAADAANNDHQQSQNSGGGLLHTLWSGFKKATSKAFEDSVGQLPGGQVIAGLVGTGAQVAVHGTQALNKPLQEVQADYRYNHEVYARQGVIPGLLVSLGMAGGAAAGAYATHSVTGGVLGAEAVGEAERGLARAGVFGDGYQQDAMLADSRNTKISAGRDLAHGLALFPGLSGLANTDKGWGKVVSGAGDATFDIGMDPLLKAGAVYKDLKYGSDVALARGSSVRDALDKYNIAPGLRVDSPEAIDKLKESSYWGKGYRRAISQIADMNAGDITARFGGQLDGLAADTTLSSGSVVKGLASASTPDEVHQVFKQAVSDKEMAQRMFSGTLPSRSLMRSTGGKVADWVRNLSPEGAVADQRSLLLPSKVAPGMGGFQAPALLSAPAKALTGDLSGAAADVSGAVAKKVRTFTGFLPFAMDPDTLALSRRTFDPMNPNALQGVYRSMRYSMGEQSARLWTDRFAQAADLGAKKRIWAEANMEMLKAAGLPDDPKLLDQVTRGVRQIHIGPAGSEMYGVGLNSGADVSKVALGNGSLDDMALWSDQRGQFAFPDFFKVKAAVRDMHGWTSGKYGSMDDFVASNYTNKIFKPLALMNAGFGLRVAFSEAIPAALRYGALHQLSARVTASAAKANYELAAPDRLTGQADALMARAEQVRTAGDTAAATRLEAQAQGIYANASTKVEHYHVLSAMSKLMGGASKLTGATVEDQDLAARIVMANEGHIVKGVSDTSHGNTSFYLPDDPHARAEGVIHYGKQWLGQRSLAPTGDFAPFAHDSDHFLESWKQELQKRSQNDAGQKITADLLDAHAAGKTVDEAAQEAIAKEAERIKDPNSYLYDKKVLGRATTQSPEQWAADRVDAMQGLLVGQDGLFHSDLAAKIAAGEKPVAADLEAIDAASRPKQVLGQTYEPWMGGGRLDALVGMGFKRLVDPVINKLSREPTYFNAVKQEWNNLTYLRANGLDDDAALRIAQYRGSMAMLPQIHNTELRTQFHALARNYLPFFFAQQQAIQRAAILVAQNPNAVRGIQLVSHGLNDPGFVQNDGSGNRYLMVPMLGELGKYAQTGMAGIGLPMVAGLPVTMSGSMESLKTVLPEMQMPGVAPMVSVPMNAFSSLSDEVHAPWANSFAGLTKDILGDRGYGAAFFDSVMPNAFVRNAIMAASPDEQSRSFSNAMLSAISSAYYHGQAPAPDASAADRQAFLDRIRNNARSLFMMKALVGLVSPLSPQVAQEDPGFRNEFYKLVKSQGYSKAIDSFLKEHGSSAISYTVAHTDAATPGASLPYTDKAINWINDNHGLVTSNLATGAAFLVPQDPSGGDAQKLSNEYLKMNLRGRRTPADFLNAMYVAAGNSAIFADKKRYDDALAATQGDVATQQALHTAWSQHTASLSLWNPVWYDDYASPVRKNLAARAYADLQQIFDSGRAPADPQSEAVRQLMDSYHSYQVQMAQMGNSRTSGADQSRQSLKSGWSDYLDTQMNTNPALAPVIRAVFSRLPDTSAAITNLEAASAAYGAQVVGG